MRVFVTSYLKLAFVMLLFGLAITGCNESPRPTITPDVTRSTLPPPSPPAVSTPQRTNDSTALLFLIDESGGMNGKCEYTPIVDKDDLRFRIARFLISLLGANYQQGNSADLAIGAYHFAGSVDNSLELTPVADLFNLDNRILANYFDDHATGFDLNYCYTDYVDAIQRAVEKLRASGAKNLALVLITDGSFKGAPPQKSTPEPDRLQQIFMQLQQSSKDTPVRIHVLLLGREVCIADNQCPADCSESCKQRDNDLKLWYTWNATDGADHRPLIELVRNDPLESIVDLPELKPFLPMHSGWVDSNGSANIVLDQSAQSHSVWVIYQNSQKTPPVISDASTGHPFALDGDFFPYLSKTEENNVFRFGPFPSSKISRTTDCGLGNYHLGIPQGTKALYFVQESPPSFKIKSVAFTGNVALLGSQTPEQGSVIVTAEGPDIKVECYRLHMLYSIDDGNSIQEVGEVDPQAFGTPSSSSETETTYTFGSPIRIQKLRRELQVLNVRPCVLREDEPESKCDEDNQPPFHVLALYKPVVTIKVSDRNTDDMSVINGKLEFDYDLPTSLSPQAITFSISYPCPALDATQTSINCVQTSPDKPHEFEGTVNKDGSTLSFQVTVPFDSVLGDQCKCHVITIVWDVQQTQDVAGLAKIARRIEFNCQLPEPGILSDATSCDIVAIPPD